MPVSFAGLYRHYINCRRNKRNTVNALKFEVRQELALLDLLDELNNRTYTPGRSVCFVNRRPKLREIFAADFRDRIVHHLVVSHLESYWERVFIHDSYACRRGKGVHVAVDRLQTFVRQVTRNGKRRAWYLQLDIHSYFMHIDKERLWRLLEPHIQDEQIRWLTRLLVFHDCAADYTPRSPKALLDQVPAHKSLRSARPGKGLPIGNLNSQFFANVYLNRLDQFVKHELKCRHYLRYCDDFILLAESQEQLIAWQGRIERFLADDLQLTLNAKRTRLRPVSDGIDFLGYIVRHDYRLVRRRVIGNLEERLNRFRDRYVQNDGRLLTLSFDPQVLEHLRAVLASYLGHFRHANAYRLWHGLWRRYGFLRFLFRYVEDSGKLHPRWHIPRRIRTVLGQYRWITAQYPNTVVLFRVGRFIEFYADREIELCEGVLGLQPMPPVRRGARYGFPFGHIRAYEKRLLEAGYRVLRVNEVSGVAIGRIKSRQPSMLRFSVINS